MKALTISTLMLALLSAACKGGLSAEPGEPMLSALRAEQGSGALSFDESRGKRLFAQYCVTCHGDEGRGDGQNASNLKPQPPDLTVPKKELGSAAIRKVITEGSAASGRSPLSPPWGRNLSNDQVDDLVAYCLTLTSRKQQ
jgi:mono/diheme cytochrome c family protein